MEETLLEKYIKIFTDKYKKEGFKKACDFMGIYFFGVIDNLPFELFENYLADSFLEFTDWLESVTEPEVFTEAYGESEPFLFKLANIITDTLDMPEDLDTATIKALQILTDEGKRKLIEIADHYTSFNKQIVLGVDTWKKDKPVYVFNDKITKKELKEDLADCKKRIVEALALIIYMDGALSITLKDKNSDTLSGFLAQDATLYAIPKKDIKKILNVSTNKNKKILVSEYDFTTDSDSKSEKSTTWLS